ncbi:MAG: hypothetical protein ACK5MW_04910 [Enterococcus sp.]
MTDKSYLEIMNESKISIKRILEILELVLPILEANAGNTDPENLAEEVRNLYLELAEIEANNRAI